MKIKTNNLYYLIFLISIIGTLGSLYFSEILGYLPCKLCNFQRVFLYPISLISFIAFITKDKKAGIRYILPLSIFGGIIALYHYLLQMGIFEESITSCTAGIPCDETYIKVFGFITIPLLSFISFITISFLSFLSKKDHTLDSV